MTRNILKFFFTLVCLYVFVISLPVQAEEGEQSTLSGQICDDSIYTLIGPEKVVKGYAQQYELVNSGTGENTEVNFKLLRDDIEAEQKQGARYVRIFNQSGNLTLQADVRSGDCSYSFKKNIQVYDVQYLSLGNEVKNIDENFSDFFRKNNILFTTLPHNSDENYDISTSQGVSALIQKYNEVFTQTQKIFIDEAVSIVVLDAFVKSLKTSKDVNFSQKDIFIVTARNYSFLSKVLAPYIKQLGIKKIGFIERDGFLDTLNNIISLTPTNIAYTSFEKEQGFFSLNVFIRYLTYSGLELSFIGLFLSIACAVLLVNFLKQCIGINAFGVYYPILLALCLVLLNFLFVLVFFIVGFFSIYLVSLISKRTYLLYTSKRTVLITLFLILTLLVLGIDNYFSLGIIDVSTFSNTFILFPFLFLLLISDKVLHEEVQILTKKGLLYLFELIFITTLCYLLMSNTSIQYFLLTFPDLLFAFLGFNILIAKYTGLQLLEYVRFTPLLKKLSEEE